MPYSIEQRTRKKAMLRGPKPPFSIIEQMVGPSSFLAKRYEESNKSVKIAYSLYKGNTQKRHIITILKRAQDLPKLPKSFPETSLLLTFIWPSISFLFRFFPFQISLLCRFPTHSLVRVTYRASEGGYLFPSIPGFGAKILFA